MKIGLDTRTGGLNSFLSYCSCYLWGKRVKRMNSVSSTKTISEYSSVKSVKSCGVA